MLEDVAAKSYATPPDTPVGAVFGNYRVVGSLGEGAMGKVYRAEHVLVGRAAAIKLLRPELANRPDGLARFLSEAKAASAIDHPGIVKVYDLGIGVRGIAFLTMELLEGESLEDRLRRKGAMSRAVAVHFAIQIADALCAAHARGIVHRDLKPANLFLVKDPLAPTGERAVILDFGIAKIVLDDEMPQSITHANMLLGSPAYMAPEQCRSADTIDYRADLYSLGCILFEMLCGRPPFVHEAAVSLIAAHLRKEPPMPSTLRPELGTAMDAILAKLLAKDPDERYQSAERFMIALSELPADAPAGASTKARTTGEKEPSTLGSAMSMLHFTRSRLATLFGSVSRGSQWLSTLVPGRAHARDARLLVAAILMVGILSLGAVAIMQHTRARQPIAKAEEVAPQDKEPTAPVSQVPLPERPRLRVRLLADPARQTQRDHGNFLSGVELLELAIREEQGRKKEEPQSLWALLVGLGKGRTEEASEARASESFIERLVMHVSDALSTRAREPDREAEPVPEAMITWRITTSPPGATVAFADGTPLASGAITPITVEFAPVPRPEVLVLALEGYETESLDVSFGESIERHVELVAIPEVTVRTEPAGAIVIGSNGEEIGRTPWTTRVPKGGALRQLTLRQEGYDDMAIAVGSGVMLPEVIALEPIPAIELAATPRKVDVYDDAGQRLGTTPMSIRISRAEGEKVLVFVREGYESASMIVRHGQTDARVALKRRVRVTLESLPSGAEVYERAGTGALLGTTPHVVEVTETAEALGFVLRHPGYHDAEVTVTPERHVTKRVALVRVPQPVTIEIVSEPEGAEVLSGDDVVGKTPYHTTELERKGTRTYVVKHSGYHAAEVTLRADRDQRKTVMLERCIKKQSQVLTGLVSPYFCEDE